MTARALQRGVPPLDRAFYDALVAARSGFSHAWEHTVPRGTGYGFVVRAGQAFRLTVVERAQIVDLCIANAHDPTEHYAAGTQLALEGGFVTRGNRIWGTAPTTRPLAFVTADTVRSRDDESLARDHICHGAHCNPHHWMLYTGTHPRTCYDNLRAGMAMVGLGQRHIHDNMNLFQRTAIDPHRGQHLLFASDAEAGDHLEFFAEIDLNVVLSLCPQGSGVDPTVGDAAVPYYELPVYPVLVGVYDTGVVPLPAPA